MVSAIWQELIEKKRADREAHIPKDWRLSEAISSKVSPESRLSAFDLLKESALLTPEEIAITEKYDATTLLELMAASKISCHEVTRAFCKRAAIAHQLTNSLTEIFFGRALERARWLDEYLAKKGRPIGPLHGLPVTLKDMIKVKGEYGTLGFISYLKHPVAEENSVIVDVLLNSGAVLYCKTNVPQTLFVAEGYNNIFGRTLNPHKLCLTPGGSSSGESAMVAIRGSIMGVGTDMGGSVRSPALCTGVFGFKPTANRIPWGKQHRLLPKGWPAIIPTMGPLAQSARDLTLFTKAVLEAQPWLQDSTALAIPWHDVPKKKSLNIGVWLNDPEFPVFPPTARILNSAVDKLKAAGHTVTVLESAPSVVYGNSLAYRSFSLETEPSVMKSLADAGEEPIPDLVATNPRNFVGKDHVADLSEVWAINAALEDYREEWAQIWRKGNLDVLLCPPSRAGTAVPHGQFGAPHYAMIWNLLDFPASVIPFLKADKSIDSKDGYDVEVVDGAPGGVQVVGWRFQDEQVLMATEIISDALA
ncbi:amidase [Trichoderma velutinum]